MARMQMSLPTGVQTSISPTQVASRLIYIGLAITGLAIALPAAAEPSISIVPGNYEMSNDIIEKTSTQCFSQDTISADTLREQMGANASNECTVADSKLVGKSLVLNLKCNYGEGVTGTGKMTLSSAGEQLTIDSEFTMTAEGQSRTMTMKGAGKRIGGC